MRPVDRRALPLLRPARVALTAVVAGGVLSGVLVVAQAFAVAALVTRLLTDPAGPGWHGPAWWLVGLTAGRAAASALSDLGAAHAAGRVTTELRADVLRAALALGRSGPAGRRTGELGLLATRGVAAVEPYLTRFLPTLVLASVLPPLTLAVIFWQDAWAGLIVLGTLPLVPVFAVLIGLATRDRADRQYRTLAALAGHFLDVVRGLPTLVTFDRADVQAGRIRVVTDRYRRATVETLRTAFASSAALELIATLSVALVAVCVGLRLAAGGLGLETALVVLLLAPEAYWPLRRVGAEFHAAAEGGATLTAVADLLATLPAREHAAAAGATGVDDRVDPVPIVIEDLVVRYDGATAPAVVLPSAVVPATGLTAVVGPSGCGKSTLLQAVLGELPLEHGSITLAGEVTDPVRWRALVAQVPQSPWLTAGTVAENLRVGRPDATDDLLWAALAHVELTDVVAALPDGLGSRLGEDGAGLSAGQRARLALARVVLANRPYVLLDEPTAHLDAATERILLTTLRRLARHATVLVVAHRPAVVAAADQVITLTRPGAPVQPPVHPPVQPPVHPPVQRAPRAVGTTAPATIAATVDLPVAPTRPRNGLVLAAVLGTLASVSGVALTATAGWLIARSAQHPPVLMLMVAIVGVRTFGLARPVLRYAERLVSHDVALRLLAESRAKVYDALVPLAPARLGDPAGRRRGDLLTSVVDDVDAELDRHLRVRLPLVAWLGTSVATAAAVALVHPVATVPVALFALGAGAAASGLAHRGVRRTESAFVDRRAELASELVDDLGSARQLVLWQVDEAASDRVRELGTRLAGHTRGTARALVAARAVVVLLTGPAVAATAWLTAPGLAAGTVSGPMAALLVLLPLALADALLPLADAGATAVRTRAARNRLAALASRSPAVTEPTRPVTVDGAASLRLHHVCAGWEEGRTVLDNLDLDLPPGASVGVVGPSGSGKSTLAALLLRHLEPSSGSYRLGGHEAADLGSREVRRHVGLVDDNPYVFGSSLRENLRLAAPHAGDEALVGALEQAGLGDWYAALPHRLDTLLGDGGADVSGGERARLGIARALLADPEVLVLDEPTAHLDSATARAVADTLRAARHGRSVVWISHDDVALDQLDRVLVTSRGRSPRCPGSPAPAPG